MSDYIVTQTRELIVNADSAADARKIAEDVFFARPGYDKSLRRSMRVSNMHVEKRRN